MGELGGGKGGRGGRRKRGREREREGEGEEGGEGKGEGRGVKERGGRERGRNHCFLHKQAAARQKVFSRNFY